MKTLKIGIASYEQMKARTMAIARGEYSPKRGEPKVWVTSLESLAKVLSADNRELLKVISRDQPASLQELADAVGREKSNVSRTLKNMERYGLIRIERKRGRIVPRVTYDHLSFEVSLT